MQKLGCNFKWIINVPPDCENFRFRRVDLFIWMVHEPCLEYSGSTRQAYRKLWIGNFQEHSGMNCVSLIN